MGLLTEANVTSWVPQAAGQPGLIADAIAMAESLAAEYCLGEQGGSLESDDSAEYHNGNGQTRIELAHTPVTALSSIYLSAQETSPSLLSSDSYVYFSATGIVTYGAGFSGGTRGVLVNYTGGYTSATMPAGLKRALLQMVAWVIAFRGNVGHKTVSADGVAETMSEMDGPVPVEIGKALSPWRRVVFG